MENIKKIIIPDSNVFMNDALAMYNFSDNEVYILDIVRTEVANKKDEKGAAGKNARLFNREMYKLINEHRESIFEGIHINVSEDEKSYGIIKIHKHKDSKPEDLTICLSEQDSRDLLILSEAKKIQALNPDKEVIIVSEDVNFGSNILLEGMEHQPYKHDKLISDIKDIYKGYIYVPVEGELFDQIQMAIENEDKKIYLNNTNLFNPLIEIKEIEDDTFLKHEMGSYQKNLISKIKLYYIHIPELTNETLYPNEFIILQKSYEGSLTDVEMPLFLNYSDTQNPFLEALRFDDSISGLKSKSIRSNVRNIQQDMLIQLAKTKHLEIIAGLGPAGSGKTLLALASALDDAGIKAGDGLASGMKPVTNNKGANQGSYKKIYVSRTFVTLEKDLGALPGTEEEKTAPLFRPIKDNLEVIMNQNFISAENASKNIEFLTFTYLQGRSIDNAVILLDEAQNTHIIDMESFITRSGEKARIYLTGDPLQVRKTGVGPLNNGLTQVVELFKGCPFFATVYMQQAVRSNKAEYATILLNRIQ